MFVWNARMGAGALRGTTLTLALAAIASGCLSFDGLDQSREAYEAAARAKDAAGSADGASATDASGDDGASPDGAVAFVDGGAAADAAADATVTGDAAPIDASGADVNVPVDAGGGDARTDAGSQTDSTECSVLTFTPNNNRVSIPDSPLLTLGSADFTLEFFVRFPSVPSPPGQLMGQDEGGGDQRKWLFTYAVTQPAPSTTLRFAFHVNDPSTGRGEWIFNVAPTIDLNRWYHLAITRNGTTFRLFQDGALIGSQSNDVVIPDISSPLTFGIAEGVTSFNGALADVRLSSNARYLSTFAPPASLEVDSNTIGLWHLNEGTGTVVRDASSNSLHGTISGATWSSGGTCVARAPRVDCTSCTAAGTVDGVNNCGPNGNESCGTSLYVPGGTYYRGDTTNYPATISSFRLDKYEVTVGRFRKFVDAWVGGWRPQAGSGKHTHLNGGQGLANTAGGYEPGWNAAWTAYLGAPSTGASAGAIPLAPGAASRADWDAVLACDSTRSTWSTVAGSVERKPINCITWYEALAYCSWDGGFLPTEGEWEFAAAGGSDEREYPWGVSAPTSDVAVFAATGTAGVGSASLGAGRWGQLDLAGNVWEWTADYFASAFGGSCNNCVGSVPSDSRAIRGASFIDSASRMRVVDRVGYPQPVRSPLQGFRCARSP